MPDCKEFFNVGFGELPGPALALCLCNFYPVFQKQLYGGLLRLFQGRWRCGYALHSPLYANARLAGADVVAVMHVRKFPIRAYIRVVVGGSVELAVGVERGC